MLQLYHNMPEKSTKSGLFRLHDSVLEYLVAAQFQFDPGSANYTCLAGVADYDGMKRGKHII